MPSEWRQGPAGELIGSPAAPDLPLGLEAAQERAEERHRKWGRIALQLALVGLAFYLTWRLLAGMSWAELWGRVEEAHGRLLGLAALLMVARFVPWDLRWRRAFARLGEEPPGPIRTYFALLSCGCVNLVTPAARVLGGLLRARYVGHRSNHSFGTVYGTVLYDQVAHSVVMGSLSGLALMGFAWSLGQAWLAVLVAVLMAVGGAVAAYWVWGRDLLAHGPVGRYCGRLAERQRLAGMMRHGKEAYGVVRALLADRPLWGYAVLLTLAYFLLNGLGQWVVFAALDRPVGLLVVFLAVTLGTAAGLLSGTPGGLGTTEAGMIVSFVALGVSSLDAAAGTLLFRGLHYLSVVALGLPALAAFELRQHAARAR